MIDENLLENTMNEHIAVGDVIEIGRIGQEPHDMMYAAPFRAIVTSISNGKALCDSDEYCRRFNRTQAVSFKVWEPLANLSKVD